MANKVTESKECSITLMRILTMVALIVVILAGIVLWFECRPRRVPRMSEGVVGVGSIRSAMRVYASGHGGNYPVLTNADGKHLAVIGIARNDLKGKYFHPRDYVVNSTATAYTVRATWPGGGPDDFYEISSDNDIGCCPY